MSIKAGDRVRLIDWDEAISLYGGPGELNYFHTPSGLYIPCDMAKYFGKNQIIYKICVHKPGGVEYFYIEECGGEWTFSSELIAPEVLIPESITLSYDEFFGYSQTNE